ncbi:VOC family protein [Amycolatopsis sp. cg5]|uniref:VOC family protein n=1 Tax=Amycolatopsis sp. cg5 TaxID=3238802 RepID=UPI003525E194
MTTRPPNLVDTLHVRLLVDNFAACFRFYNAILPKLAGSTLAKGVEDGPYARWDIDAATPQLALLDRGIMAAMLGQENVDTIGDPSLLCLRTADVDGAQRLCEEHGAIVLSPARDRPEWAPDTRIAYLRDPGGNLIELQCSPD